MPEVKDYRCKARQCSDQMGCVCGLVWDMNDPDPPVCPEDEKRRQAVKVDMPRQDFDSRAGAGKVSAVQQRYGGKFGVSWASTDIATADTMARAVAIAKAVAESGADNISDMRAVAREVPHHVEDVDVITEYYRDRNRGRWVEKG